MVELILVDGSALKPLRRQVLGGRQAPEWPGDSDPRSLHLVLKQRKQILAGVSLTHGPRGELGSEVWRVRGPLVLPDQRRTGLGRQLMLAVQAVVEKRGGGLWAKVPLAALPFFSALGFRAVADAGKGEEDLLLTWRPKP